MKVNIGPYLNYITIYDYVDKLKYIGLFEGAIQNLGDYLDETFIGKAIRKRSDRRQRKIKVHIDEYDTWGMYSTLALIISPMLHQLKATQQGWPITDDEDVPDYLKTYDLKYENDEGDVKFPAKWEYILNEMIYAFDTVDSEWEEKYYSGEWNMIEKEVMIDGEELFEMVPGPNHTYKCDREGLKKEADRIANGFRLFGKYYQNLWD